jgi:putative addiction module component (TIGR02574 family)
MRRLRLAFGWITTSDNGENMNTKQLIDEAVSLPVEERALVVDSLLRSLNQPESEIDNIWAKEAKQRLDELRSGRVKAIPGEEVFKKVWERFKK